MSIAHPYWSTVSIADADTLLASAHAVEVYNHGCQVEVDRGDSWHFTDILLGRGDRLTAIATDDAHFNHKPEPDGDAYGGWVHVKSESLDPESLLAALKAGHFYSSTGPEIHDVRIEGDEVHIACSQRMRSSFRDRVDIAPDPAGPGRGWIGPDRTVPQGRLSACERDRRRRHTSLDEPGLAGRQRLTRVPIEMGERRRLRSLGFDPVLDF